MKLVRYRSYSREEIHNIYSSELNFVIGAGKWGLHGIVSIPKRKRDFIFFVTFGTSESGFTFKEGITKSGILTWQSKPSQKLNDPQINKFINHDHTNDNIYLLLRTNSKSKYTYIGNLKYESHNPAKEKPVQFQWQIQEWKIEKKLFNKIGLELGDHELDEDPYSPKTIFKIKNQLIESKKLPVPRKKRSLIKPGTRIVNVDFVKKALELKKNGKKGELLVMEYERQKLKKLGVDKNLVHVSLEGDGHGYDIESYNENGEKIFIEVKTTIAGRNTSFDVTSNEVLVSNEKLQQYYIYRLYNYDKKMNSAEFYTINGSISKNFNLEATQYSAFYKG